MRIDTHSQRRKSSSSIIEISKWIRIVEHLEVTFRSGFHSFTLIIILSTSHQSIFQVISLEMFDYSVNSCSTLILFSILTFFITICIPSSFNCPPLILISKLCLQFCQRSLIQWPKPLTSLRIVVKSFQLSQTRQSF